MSVDIKTPFFRVSVTIEPVRSLLTVRYHELFDYAGAVSTVYAVLCWTLVQLTTKKAFYLLQESHRLGGLDISFPVKEQLTLRRAQF